MSSIYAFGFNSCHQINSSSQEWLHLPRKLSYEECVKISLLRTTNPNNNSANNSVDTSLVAANDSMTTYTVKIIDVKIAWNCIVALNSSNEPLVWCYYKNLPAKTSFTFTTICLGSTTNAFYDATSKTLLMSNDEFGRYRLIKIKSPNPNSQDPECRDEFMDIQCTGDEKLFFLSKSNVLYQSECTSTRCRAVECLQLVAVPFSRAGSLSDGLLNVPKIKQVVCGKHHTLCLSLIGLLFSFGNGNQGQLGLGTLESTDEPKLIEALAGVQIVKISAGGWHNLAISDCGDIYAWGWNNHGQLGLPFDNGDDTDTDNDDSIVIPIEELNAADTSSSSSNSHNVEAPTLPSQPQFQIQTIPSLVDLPKNSKCPNRDKTSEAAEGDEDDNKVIDIACGARHSICLTDKNEVYTWGWNKLGQLGYITPKISQWRPQRVDFFNFLNVKSVYAGGWNSVVQVEDV